MAQSRLACALAGAAVSVFALTGCAGGDPGAAQTPSDSPSASASATVSVSPSATPTPTPSPASADGPAVNIPVPEKPALADENSVEGLEAFTEWWFELVNYGIATSSFDPMWLVTDQGCVTCNNIEASIEEVYSEGGWQVGGEVALEGFGSEFEVNTAGSVGSYLTSTQTAITVYDESGEVINEIPAVSKPEPSGTFATWMDGAWVMLDFGLLTTE